MAFGLENRSAAFKDLIILIIIFIVLSICSMILDLFERFETLAAQYDHYEIDEIIITISMFSLFICIYAFRRWKELRAVIKKREEDDARLKAANLALKKKTEALEFHNQQGEKLIGMARLLQVCKSKEELFRLISHSAIHLFKDTGGSIYITKHSRNQLSKVTFWGEHESTPEFISPDDCWGLRLGKRYPVESNFNGPSCHHAIQANTHSCHCIPLTAYGEIIGLLHISQANQTDAKSVDFNSAVIENTLPLFTEEISLAISNLTLQERLRDMAIRDPLTGLYNRQYLKETVERELHHAKRNRTHLGVVMIDLDHFKKFNDTFGHAAGDLLLKEMGRLLTDFFRLEDFCCRYGGEELLILLPDISKDDLEKRCEELRKNISELQIFYQDKPLGKVTGSLGAAITPDNGEEFTRLLRAADEALYAAKKEGRNQVRLAWAAA